MVSHTVEGAARAAPRHAALGPRIAAVVLVAAGAFLGYVAVKELDGEGATVGGPRFAPLVVTGAWIVLAVVYLIGQLRRPSTVEELAATDDDLSSVDTGGPAAGAPHQRAGRLRPMLLAVALLAYAALLEPVGFALASAAFFVAAARILGSRSRLRDVVVGVALAFGAYLAFTRLLDIQLPGGVLPL